MGKTSKAKGGGGEKKRETLSGHLVGGLYGILESKGGMGELEPVSEGAERPGAEGI